jgi:hypothetical protein
MNPRPLSLSHAQRALLRELEGLHEEWRRAIAAGDAIEYGTQGERLLEYRIAADRVQREAMRLVRGAPI